MKSVRKHIAAARYAYIWGLLVFFLWQAAGQVHAWSLPAQAEQQQQAVGTGSACQDTPADREDTSQACWEQGIVHKAVLSVLRFDFKHPFLFLFNISLPSPESTRIAFPDFPPRLIYYEYLFRYFVVVNAP
ncbi:MAG: hypothetical protein KatS3mg033_1988 [Thermonema sp.]|uniref:hypothetical protein n=1 Tax=Thermonema sp. TaxID=2231181 RepID=UPI0021DC973D|nr:hypothetical protein [Thermonema sp.]GIV40188.1 MAG: hypothetical protein KatS3mg033_1988 [Thermonema sp.]